MEIISSRKANSFLQELTPNKQGEGDIKKTAELHPLRVYQCIFANLFSGLVCTKNLPVARLD